MPAANHRMVESTDGVSVALHDLGGRGPTLLLCHATGLHGRVWGPVAEALADSFRCMALDFRGHGDSTVPDGLDYQWDGMADDVLAVVDALGGPRLAAGWSMGGAAIVMAEQRRPGTFDRAWLLEPILIPRDRPWGSAPGGGTSLAESARRRREVFDSRDAAYERYARRRPFSACDPAGLRAYVDHGFGDQPDGTVILKCRGATEAAVFEASVTDAYERLGEVATATTVVASGDGQPPALVAVDAAAALPNGHLERLGDLTHFAPLENPARVADSIRGAVT